MSQKKIDTKTTKKLLANYKNTISKYSLENEKLTLQLKDLKTTFTINQNLLYDFIKNTIGEDEKINSLINENKSLWTINESLIKQKNDLLLKNSKLQEFIEDTPSIIRKEINKINIQNDKIKNELVQKDSAIKKLKIDLIKSRRNALFRTARTEIQVMEPTKTNVEINHELLNTKSIMAKVISMQAEEKKKVSQLHKEVKSLKNEISKLKKISFNSQGELKQNNINDSKDDSNKNNNIINLKIKGFDLLVNNKDKDKEDGKEEEEEEEEEEESEGTSEDDDDIFYEGRKRPPHNKNKELSMLTEQYNMLEKQNLEYEKKVNEYKNIYKSLKNKINFLKQIPHINEGCQKQNNNNNNNAEKHNGNLPG